MNWRQHDFVKECTIMDSALCIMRDGSLKVAKVADKVFMGRNIIHIDVWPQDGDTHFYTMIYQDKASGKAFAKRFQIQEKMTSQVAQLIQQELEPSGVGVIIEATHQCMTTRGVHKTGVTMLTSQLLGAFREDPKTRKEFMALVGKF